MFVDAAEEISKRLATIPTKVCEVLKIGNAPVVPLISLLMLRKGHEKALTRIRQEFEALWDSTEVPLDAESIARRLRLKAYLETEQRQAKAVQSALVGGYRYAEVL